jgi:hypothetical protein
MLDWLVSLQFPDGAFQGGAVYAEPRLPVVFNTGQILLGLAAGVGEFGDEYREPMRRAADWLVKAQDQDGCWRRFESAFVVRGEKAYHTHVAWGLLEADRVDPARKYGAAALANVRWALSKQESNGWFRDCCVDDPARPLTHTLGYALRGILEAYRFSADASLLEAAAKTADGLLGTIEADGHIAGRILPDWQAATRWSCLTGSAQLALCWLSMYEFTGERKYRDAAFAANKYVRRRINLGGPPETKGGVKGAFPVDGAYHDYSYINWANKFVVDANMCEARVRDRESRPSPVSAAVLCG